MTKMRKNEFYWRKCENDAVPRRFAPRLTLLSSALDLFWKAVTHVTALYLQQRVHISLSFHWFIIGAFSSPLSAHNFWPYLALTNVKADSAAYQPNHSFSLRSDVFPRNFSKVIVCFSGVIVFGDDARGGCLVFKASHRYWALKVF